MAYLALTDGIGGAIAARGIASLGRDDKAKSLNSPLEEDLFR